MRGIALALAVIFGASTAPVSASFYELLDAARTGDLAAVRTLLVAGEQVDPFGPGDGYSPLQFAAEHGDIEMVRLLLAAGADPEYRDHNGDRALLWAADEGQAVAIRLLLAAGSPPNSPDDPYGRTPLMQAATSHSAAAVKVLLDAGANPHAWDQSGLTPLHYASWQGNAETVALLLAAGVNPNTITGTLHETPLHYAVSDTAMVQALIAAGIDPDVQNHDGWTALYRAVKAGRVESVRVLLAGYAKADVPDRNGVTPLMVAAELGHVEIARLLLEYGASKSLRDHAGNGVAFYLADPGETPGLDIDLDLSDHHMPRNHVVYVPSPEEIATLRANREAIRAFLRE